MAKGGGTPVILDDALGYTDQERLKLMGAVLAVAAKECQLFRNILKLLTINLIMTNKDNNPETLTKPPTREEAIRYMNRAEEVLQWLKNLL